MSVKMNFGNLKYAIGSSRAIKLSKSKGPSTNMENTSTINLSTKSNVENLLSRKNLNIKTNNEKTEKFIDSNIASIKTIPVANKNPRHINKIQFISQPDRNKIKEKEKVIENLNSNKNFLTNMNTNLNTKKTDEIFANKKTKHQKTSSEIPRNIASNNYIFDNFNSHRNSKETSNKKREIPSIINNTNSNTNRNKFLNLKDYNNTTNTFNKEDYERAEMDLNINMNLTNHSKFGKNAFKSVERKNEVKSLNSEIKDSKSLTRNVYELKSEDENIRKVNMSKDNILYDDRKKTEKNYNNISNNNTKNKLDILNTFSNSETNHYKNNQDNLDIKYNELNIMNKELLKTIDILKTYITVTQNVTEKKKKDIEKKLKEKDEEIKKLKDENKAIIKHNNELKTKMLHFLNQVKTYELTEIQREKTVNKYLAQLLIENDYLRSSNEKLVSLHLSRENNLPNKYSQDRQEKDKTFNKINHKRQKTQINFTNTAMHVRGASETVTNIDKINNIPVPNNNATIAKDNDSSFNTKNSESSVLNTSSTSIISNKKDDNDAFSSAFIEMQMNQTIRKSSVETVDDQLHEGPPVFILSPSANSQKHKPSYLFYRTPGNKEHKKIEYN